MVYRDSSSRCMTLHRPRRRAAGPENLRKVFIIENGGGKTFISQQRVEQYAEWSLMDTPCCLAANSVTREGV